MAILIAFSLGWSVGVFYCAFTLHYDRMRKEKK